MPALPAQQVILGRPEHPGRLDLLGLQDQLVLHLRLRVPLALPDLLVQPVPVLLILAQ